jgi:L-serine dehydratase
MNSLKEFFRIGVGPSSSHTMGPRRAAEIFHKRHPHASRFRLTLFGSLGATGRGHLTDLAVLAVFPSGALDLVWQPDEQLPEHPNGMRFEAFSADGQTSNPGTFTASAAARSAMAEICPNRRRFTR